MNVASLTRRNDVRPLNHMSLFTGSGIGDLAAECAGLVTVAQCECDPMSLVWLSDRWPRVKRFEDVRYVTAQSMAGIRAHVISGGFPCQDISSAGKGAGLDGDRSGLWFEMLRVITELGPDWVLVENVPALRTRGADIVIAGLEGAGYAVWPVVVGAWACGAPQRRDRVWLVARKCGTRNGECEMGNAACDDERWDGVSGTGGRGVAHRGSGGGVADGVESRGGGLPVLAGGQGETGGDIDGGGEGLGDTAGGELQESGRRSERRDGVGQAGSLGHTDVPGREQQCWPESVQQERQAVERGSGRSMADAEDADGWTGVEGEQGKAGCGRHRPSDIRFDLWPARRGAEQFEWEEPRTIESAMGGSVDGVADGLLPGARRQCLKMLGNGWVPQIPYVIFTWMVKMNHELRGG